MQAKAIKRPAHLPWPEGRSDSIRFILLHLALVLLAVLGATACSTAKSGGAAREGAAHAAQPGALELNGGKKWVVDKPMMVHLRNLEQSVQHSDGTSPKDHTALARSIEEHLGRLVTNCTMQGRAHDELHKWLMPFLGLSAAYSQAKDPVVQEQKFQEIRQALVVFNRYFE